MVSVIIPTYNREKVIRKSINSVLKQGKIVSEIIIVDDGSTDNTEEIIKEFNDSRIKYIKNKESKGACASRNIGITNCSFEIIAFNDSDDEWLNGKLERQLKYIEEYGYDFVCCGYNKITDSSQVYMECYAEENEIFSKLLKGNFIGTPTIVGKKEILINELFDEEFPRFQDWELMLRVSKKYKVKLINEALVNAYIQQDSITKNNRSAIIALQLIMNKYKEYFNNELESFYLRRLGVYSLYDDVNLNFFIEAFKKHKSFITTVDYILAKFKLVRTLKLLHKN